MFIKDDVLLPPQEKDFILTELKIYPLVVQGVARPSWKEREKQCMQPYSFKLTQKLCQTLQTIQPSKICMASTQRP